MGYEQLHDGVADYATSFELINRGYTPNKRRAGQWFETTEEIFNYFLNVLPPLYFDGSAFMMCERSTDTLSDAFLKSDRRFFCLCAEHGGYVNTPQTLRAFRKHLAEGVPA